MLKLLFRFDRSKSLRTLSQSFGIALLSASALCMPSLVLAAGEQLGEGSVPAAAPDLAASQNNLATQLEQLITTGQSLESTPMAKALIEFTVEPRLLGAIESIRLENIETGLGVELPLNQKIQVVSLPAGNYRPDINALSHAIYGAHSSTKIKVPADTSLTLQPNAVTYLGHWRISQSKAHSGRFAHIANRKTQLSVVFDSTFQPWVEKNAAEATRLPLHASAFGQHFVDHFDWVGGAKDVALGL